jgi:drug/metabolite transporter (DMT)-like permease
MSSIAATDAPASARAFRLGLAALLLGALAISSSPIFVRLSELGPTATGFHRTFLALPLLAFWWWRVQGGQAAPVNRWDEFRPLILPGLIFAGDLFFWHLSVAYTSVANASLLANMAPVVVAAGAWLLLGERISVRFMVGLAAALAGTSMLVGSSADLGQRFVLGDAFALITALFYGSYLLSIAGLRGRYGAARIMYVSTAVSAAALLPLALIMGESIWPTTLHGWLMLIGLAWICQALGQALIAYSLGHLPASYSSLVILLQPFVSALFGWIILGEALGPLQMAGAVAVLAGILLARSPRQAAAG